MVFMIMGDVAMACTVMADMVMAYATRAYIVTARGLKKNPIVALLGGCEALQVWTCVQTCMQTCIQTCV